MTKRIIDEEELLWLLKRDAVLSTLEFGGVNNWEWFEDCLRYLDLPDEESLAKYPIAFAESADADSKEP